MFSSWQVTGRNLLILQNLVIGYLSKIKYFPPFFYKRKVIMNIGFRRAFRPLRKG